MTFSLHDSIDPNGFIDSNDYILYSTPTSTAATRENMHILREKLQIPDASGLIGRPRLNSLLEKSLAHFPATLITGRSGTGKTALATVFASNFTNVAWYSVESTDLAWPIFSRYFSASQAGDSNDGDVTGPTERQTERQVERTEIAQFLVSCSSLSRAGEGSPSLIVLDDVHHVFDTPWFEDFLNLLLYSLPTGTHLLLLCRSEPPSPLWRLRSKQMLNVIDEKVIAFNAEETGELFNSLNLPKTKAKEAQRQSFGRVSKLLQFANDCL